MGRGYRGKKMSHALIMLKLGDEYMGVRYTNLFLYVWKFSWRVLATQFFLSREEYYNPMRVSERLLWRYGAGKSEAVAQVFPLPEFPHKSQRDSKTDRQPSDPKTNPLRILKVQGSGGQPVIKTHVASNCMGRRRMKTWGIPTAVIRRTPKRQASGGVTGRPCAQPNRQQILQALIHRRRQAPPAPGTRRTSRLSPLRPSKTKPVPRGFWE